MSIAGNINIAQVCGYLVTRDIEKGLEKDTRLSRKIYMVRKSLEWMNANTPTDPTINAVSDYLYSMCGKYAFEAQGIIGSGGSGFIVSPTVGAINLVPFYGSQTITAAQAGVQSITNPAWVGLVGLNQITIQQNTLQLGAQFLFNAATGTIDLSIYPYTLQVNDLLTFQAYKTSR